MARSGESQPGGLAILGFHGSPGPKRSGKNYSSGQSKLGEDCHAVCYGLRPTGWLGILS